MNLFNADIGNWKEWSKVFQSIPVFTPLVEHILKKEHLPAVIIENLTPGTNAVFKAGDYVIKIFAPAGSGMDQTLSLQSELFAMKFVNDLNVSAPKLIANGLIEDKYSFAYMITEYIRGISFTEAVKIMTDNEKAKVGLKLRKLTGKMNVPCNSFNGIDVIYDKTRWIRWDKYPEQFKVERLKFIKTHDYGEKVFVHGDLNGDNILISQQDELCIIDFGDAVLAPLVYEQALIAVELLEFDPIMLHGYFGKYTTNEIADLCFNGLLIHDFGGDIVEHYIGKPIEFGCLTDLRKKLKDKIDNEEKGRIVKP